MSMCIANGDTAHLLLTPSLTDQEISVVLIQDFFSFFLSFFFPSAGFAWANGIYMWKSTFLVCKVTVPMTKFMVTHMTELHMVYLAMVVITIMKLRVY